MIELLRELFAFHAWARVRVLDAAEQLPFEGLRRPMLIAGGNEDGSLHATLSHLAAAEAHWLARWQDEPQHQQQRGSDFANLAAIAQAWQTADNGILALLASEPDLERRVRYFRESSQTSEEQPLWQQLLHVSNHTTHHRAEACAALTALGSPPASVDLIEYLRRR